MVHVGNRYDLGVEMFSPIRKYSVTGNGAGFNGEATSDQTLFIIPHGGANFMLGGNSSVGVSVYGNGGMNTEYPTSVFGGNQPTGVDLSQLFLNISYAQKIGTMASVGAGVILVQQRFKIEGADSFAGISSDANNLSNNGYANSTGIGIRLGGMIDIPGNVTLGISFQPKIDMSEFDKYKGLFAEQGDFDIPSTYVLGAAWKPMPDLLLALDIQRINYSDAASVSNPGPVAFGPPLLGSANGPGFAWEDITVVKLGAAFTSGSWTWRAGWNHGDNPIPDTETFFNILAPGVVEDHLTFGFTKRVGSNNEINFSYMHALKNEVTGPLPVGLGGGTGSIEMYQNSLEISLGTKF